ncbi:MAG: hypothetical protein R2849_12900 [Thermomicrobiales bacterium]
MNRHHHAEPERESPLNRRAGQVSLLPQIDELVDFFGQSGYLSRNVLIKGPIADNVPGPGESLRLKLRSDAACVSQHPR